MSNHKDPFANLVLDEEEQAIEDAIERGEYESVVESESNRNIIEEAAKRHVELNSTKPITLRVKQTDIMKIKTKAARSGIPYQTLLNALVHDFAEGNRELTIK